MGHERVGVLPRSRRWRVIVDEIAAASLQPEKVGSLADSTLDAVRSRYANLPEDRGVQAAFEFLLAFSNAAASEKSLWPELALDPTENPSQVRVAAALKEWVRRHEQSIEYAELATKAGSDAVADWQRERQRQASLFGASASQLWASAATPAGFCEIARLFFSNFTRRYLNYFLEREASAVAPSIAARDELAERLRQHVDIVSQHAFETSKITQSFAAGWFTKHASNRRPKQSEIRNFLAVAFNKIREELWREANIA